MSSKTEILAQIARLQQELNQLTTMVSTMNEESVENETVTVTRNTTISNDPYIVVATLLQAAQSANDTDRDELLNSILHSNILNHNPAIDSFLRFSFRTLQGRWQEYLQDSADFHSFSVVRKQQNDRGELSDLRLYLSATHRSPCPITLQQDPKAEYTWKIVSSSL